MIPRILNRAEEGAIAFLLAFMTVVTFGQVVLRYVFNSGMIWAHEATTYAFLWMVLIGISYGVRVNAHIGVDIVIANLPRTPRRVLGLIGVGLCLLYAGLMGYGSYVFVDRMMDLGNYARDLPLPRWLLSLALPIGFGLLILRLIQVALAIVAGKRDRIGLGHEDEIDMSLAADRASPVSGLTPDSRTVVGAARPSHVGHTP
ncbi:TRAP transporter small permease (plasmid) [Skermanella mucosa]|uniref:TRAP transporter small permease n=1 Tax=Skermanella mucosa TaxID=1789672 RepID=UPI00192BF422|nr:TRAP transporter small permease [Skermanella mucosa]UEM24563.1 TRAP transporter small permease [Skermanella mucosa]